jgi:hypothetical protein
MGARFCPLKRPLNEKLRAGARSFAIVKASWKSSFGISPGKNGGFATVSVSTSLSAGFTTFVAACGAARLTARTVAGRAASRLAFATGVCCTFGSRGCNFNRHVLNDGLRARTGDFRLRLRLTLRPIVLLGPVLLLRPGLLLRRLLVPAITTTITILAGVVVGTVEILAVALAVVLAVVAVLATIAVVALETFLHLRLSGRDDAVVVLGMLQVVFRHDTIARALRIACQSRILLGDVLSGTADFHIGAGAVIGPGKRVLAFAVEIVVSTTAATAATVVTPPTTLVLLSWPHRCFT